ncbi:hypothetical protein F383_03718 [Gossypium arboreum]|uniref:Uncharacterized protein n=1 Tax=Gossypium arboreum TaxID=29729 RepID=A0A0B0P9C9_GOSAR|nr:hypothetical protein F383_03718 [Gossypium arboreum]
MPIGYSASYTGLTCDKAMIVCIHSLVNDCR